MKLQGPISPTVGTRGQAFRDRCRVDVSRGLQEEVNCGLMPVSEPHQHIGVNGYELWLLHRRYR